MRVEVEPTGCTERKGLVQIRFAMYLEPGDYGYDVHHVQVKGEWQTNPFHNHFIYVEPELPDKDIMDIGEAFLHEAYTKWASGERLGLRNPPVLFPAAFDSGALAAKVQSLKTTKLERKV